MEVLVGFVIMAAMYAAGFLHCRRRMRRRLAQPKPAICEGCDHNFSFVDRSTGECHAITDQEEKLWSGGKFVGTQKMRCQCRRYVGPVPAELDYEPELPETRK